MLNMIYPVCMAAISGQAHAVLQSHRGQHFREPVNESCGHSVAIYRDEGLAQSGWPAGIIA
jgi:hypothetical protein